VTNYSHSRSPLSYLTFLLNLTRKANPRQISPHQAFSLERWPRDKTHQTPLLLRLLESLTNGILFQSNAPGQKEDDIDYAFYSKEPSQLMKEQLGNG